MLKKKKRKVTEDKLQLLFVESKETVNVLLNLYEFVKMKVSAWLNFKC